MRSVNNVNSQPEGAGGFGLTLVISGSRSNGTAFFAAKNDFNHYANHCALINGATRFINRIFEHEMSIT
jgi:hypothetical protein